jgi:hypothetical protein
MEGGCAGMYGYVCMVSIFVVYGPFTCKHFTTSNIPVLTLVLLSQRLSKLPSETERNGIC